MLVTTRLFASTILVISLIPGVAIAEDLFQVTTLAPDLLMLSSDQGSYSNNSLVFKL